MRNIRSALLVFWVLLLLSACDSPPEKDKRPWAFRSVLDNKPRMLTILLDSQLYLAYDLARCQLHKVWKGGIDIQGAPYTDVKNIQPNSWGKNYTDDEIDPFQWIVLDDGTPISVEPRHTGYLFEKGKIMLGYRFILNSGDTVQITEKPTYFTSRDQEKPGLKRQFLTRNIPLGIEIMLANSTDTIRLVSNRAVVWELSFDPITTVEQPVPETRFDDQGKLIIAKSDCATCHELEQKMVGPSYLEIAQRYAGQKVKDELTSRIINGSKGQWGEAMMTPHPNLTEKEVRQSVDYILSLAEFEESDEPVNNKVEPVKPYVEKPKPGFGAALEGLHPSFDVTVLHRSDFQPRVGAMAFMPDGRLLVSTWDKAGGVYLLDSVQGDSTTLTVKQIASGLHEPLGLEVVDGEIFVLQKHELTQLIDHDGDEISDEYKVICNAWDASADFHEFAFGLVYQDNHFYVTLSMAMRLLESEEQLFDRGRTLKIARDGSYDWINFGMRTPNGIGVGPDNEIFISDNQGQWTPANKIIHLQKGAYMGMRWGILEGMTLPKEIPPAVWLPQDEIGNSPSEILLVHEGPFKGQMLHGDVTNGGIKRDFLEKIGGQYQGAVFRFTQGLTAGINRMRWGPDGHLYVGGVGMVGGWSWKGRQYGLERLEYSGKPTFEILAVRAQPDGFEIEMTLPIKQTRLKPEDIRVQQWRYVPTSSYGGPKVDLETLSIASVSISEDQRKLDLQIPGLKPGHVVYFLLPESLQSSDNLPLWSGEAWYTLNNIPSSD